MPQANYRIPGGFVKLPRWFANAVEQLALTPFEVTSYTILLCLTDSRTGLAYLSDRELAARGNMNRKSAQKALHGLREHKLIVMYGLPGKRGRATAYLLPPRPPEGVRTRPLTGAKLSPIRPARGATDRREVVTFTDWPESPDSAGDLPAS